MSARRGQIASPEPARRSAASMMRFLPATTSRRPQASAPVRLGTGGSLEFGLICPLIRAGLRPPRTLEPTLSVGFCTVRLLKKVHIEMSMRDGSILPATAPSSSAAAGLGSEGRRGCQIKKLLTGKIPVTLPELTADWRGDFSLQLSINLKGGKNGFDEKAFESNWGC